MAVVALLVLIYLAWRWFLNDKKRLNGIDLVCGSVFKNPARFNHLFSFFFYLHVSFITIPTL